MSKSLGNLVMVANLLQRWTPDTLRLYLARHHYREVWAHDPGELEQSETLAGRLLAAVTARSGNGQTLAPAEAEAAFDAALDDDLNTPAALSVMESLAGDIEARAQAGGNVAAAQGSLRGLCRVFGLRLEANAVEPRVTAGWSQHLLEFADGAESPNT
jgi:cysteinyl-tRNA synthetase